MVLKDYTVLDIETTGLSKDRHRITEIAAVRYNGRRRIGQFHSLVNPEVRIPSFITSLTGINNEMVRDAPTISKVLPGFLEFLGGSVIVAHNASFDYGFIEHNARAHLKLDLANKRLCTRRLANRMLPDLPSKRLGSLCEVFKIRNKQAHRAMGDAEATAQVFHKFLRLLPNYDVRTEDDLFSFECSPRSRKQ
ncbi:3'-5' exonuclease [Candidatus Woesearchaeota archaeon]|nr:3'-5' exonuclease [Candidatus Woesearchaeota archaeon]